MLPNVIIREFMPQDVAGVIRLHRESEDQFEKMDVTEEFILSISQRKDFRFFTAAMDASISGAIGGARGGAMGGNVTGYVGVLFYEHVGRAEIGPIAVDGNHRNMGVGTMLLEKAMEFLNEKRIHRVISKVKLGNPGAADFFHKMGFRQEGCFRDYTEKKEDVIQFVRFI